MDPDHHRKLENMYRCSPCNEFYAPEITIGDGSAEVTFAVRPEFHHAAGTLHGSVYFKALDDAAYFAAASLRDGHFLVTSTFTKGAGLSAAQGDGVEARTARAQACAAMAECLEVQGEYALGCGHRVSSPKVW